MTSAKPPTQDQQNLPEATTSPETNANSEAGNPRPGAPSTTDQKQQQKPPRADSKPEPQARP